VASLQERSRKTGAPVYGADIIWMPCHTLDVSWIVEIGDEFEPEFDALHVGVQREILALSRVLQQFGPQLGRPRVRHAERVSAREHEGTALQRSRW
jgi:hypothetical protein